MQIKKHLKNGKNVSMGFGFIEFDSTDTAANVCGDLQVITKWKLDLNLCVLIAFKPFTCSIFFPSTFFFVTLFLLSGNCLGRACSHLATLSCQER